MEGGSYIKYTKKFGVASGNLLLGERMGQIRKSLFVKFGSLKPLNKENTEH